MLRGTSGASPAKIAAATRPTVTSNRVSGPPQIGDILTINPPLGATVSSYSLMQDKGSGLTVIATAQNYTLQPGDIPPIGSSYAYEGDIVISDFTSPSYVSSNPATVPGAPTIGTATAGNAQISSTFTAPTSNGGSSITNYLMSVFRQSDNALVGQSNNAASPGVLTGIANGVAVYCTFIAQNSVGNSISSNASNIVTPSSAVSSVRQVATGTFIPDAILSEGNHTQLGTRSPHTAMVNMTTAAIVIPNWYMASGSEHEGAGTLTATASIEYPAGTFTKVTFGGNNSGSVAAGGGNLVSDSVAVSIPQGAKFWVRVYQVIPSGATSFTYYAFDGTCKLSGGTAVSDFTMGGGEWNSQGAINTFGTMWTPAAIIANSSVPAVGIYGDSISVGRGDTNDGTRPITQGHLGRAFGATYPCGHVGVSGDLLSQFIAGHTRRLQMAQYFTHFVWNMGINDLTGSHTVAQITADTNTVVSYFPGQKVGFCTLSPNSGSSDGWTTVSGQSVSGFAPGRLQINTQRLSNFPTATVVYDVNPYVENIPSPEDSKWTVVGGVNTIDGTHWNALSCARFAASANISLLIP